MSREIKSDYPPSVRLLLLYFYLLKTTNENHGVSVKEIRHHFMEDNIFLTEKSVYADIKLLKELMEKKLLDGEIQYNKGRGGYCLTQHTFESYELRLMVDSIQSSRFITQKEADRISSKIVKLTDWRTAESLNRRAFVANRIRSKNDSVVLGTDTLHACIQSGIKVKFKFFHYGVNKEKVYSNKGKFIVVSPYALLWNNGYYYLYAYDSSGKTPKFKHYRVDRMEYVMSVNEKRDGELLFSKKDLTARQSKLFNMYSGEEHTVRLRCINRLADAILDRFGKDVMLVPDDSKHFIVPVQVEVNDQFFSWVASFGRQMKIVSPEPVVQQMRVFLDKVSEMYKEEG